MTSITAYSIALRPKDDINEKSIEESNEKKNLLKSLLRHWRKFQREKKEISIPTALLQLVTAEII